MDIRFTRVFQMLQKKEKHFEHENVKILQTF